MRSRGPISAGHGLPGLGRVVCAGEVLEAEPQRDARRLCVVVVVMVLVVAAVAVVEAVAVHPEPPEGLAAFHIR